MIPTHESAPSRGFTIVEFLMVIVITGILVVGLAAVVDVPATMMQNENGAQSGATDVDRGFAELDKDVRYAVDVRAPDARTLEVDLRDGRTVTYTWAGVAGGALWRTVDGENVKLVKNLQGLEFLVGTAPYTSNMIRSVATTATDSVGASFTGYSLLPGFTFLGRTVGTVVETVSTRTISDTEYGGFFFTVPGGSTDEAFADFVVLPLARFGTGDLYVSLYEADASRKLPLYASEVAQGILRNREIPVARADVPIRFGESRRLRAGTSYFIQVRGRGGSAALLETRLLSNPLAILDWGGGFLFSNNAGANWSMLSATLATSQARFCFKASKEEDADSGDTNDVFDSVTVELPVKVHVRVDVVTGSGVGRSFQTSIPIENNLALLHQ